MWSGKRDSRLVNSKLMVKVGNEVLPSFNYEQFKTMEERAKWFSYYHHYTTLHMYDGKPYHEAHLTKVVDVAKRYLQWISPEVVDHVLAACWLHDTIEDCRVTYNDVAKLFGEGIADIVYALTNEKGKTRKERAGHVYYNGIKVTPYATFVKLCDRIANVEYAKENGSRMLDVYRQEHPAFVAFLDNNFKYVNMWNYLEELLDFKR